MNDQIYDDAVYADLLVRAGVNLPSGGNLFIRYHPGGALLARRCAEAAYALGAALVDLRPIDLHVNRARIAAQGNDHTALGAVPGWTAAWQRAILTEDWSYLALESFEDVGLMAGLDPEAAAAFDRLQREPLREFNTAVTEHRFPWCVAGVPGPNWARRVLGEDATTDDLKALLGPILLLNRDNPAAAWQVKAGELVERSDKLNSLKFETLLFRADGTDLRIGLTGRAVWKGGPETSRGRITLPNIPTEEVFTTPDFRRCDGHVLVTRPVEVRGTVVKGARLEFRDGVLVDFSADEGRDALAGYVGTDEGARRLGEVALVDQGSPIARSGLVFSSVLYDENASCHIALGAGYPGCLADGDSLTADEEKIRAGCNVSLVHWDFMIGSDSMDVTGIDRRGRETPVMRGGRFVI